MRTLARQRPNLHHEPATVLDVLASVKRAKFFIIFFMVVGLGAAAVFLTLAIPSYKAQMIVGPAAPIL